MKKSPFEPARPSGVFTAVCLALFFVSCNIPGGVPVDSASADIVSTPAAFPRASIRTALVAGQQPGPIVADHTVVDRYADIPQEYLDRVKTMLLSLPGESHGLGYLYGLELINDDVFAAAVSYEAPVAASSEAMRAARALYTLDSSRWQWKTRTGEAQVWTTPYARNNVMETIRLLNSSYHYNRDAGYPQSVFLWAWCWDMTSPEGLGLSEPDPAYGNIRWTGRSFAWDETSGRFINRGPWGVSGDTYFNSGAGVNSISLQTYLQAMVEFENFVGVNGFNTSIVFTTGPVDGGSNKGENGYQREVKHEAIRAFVRENNEILFDYADILSYGDEGVQKTTAWNTHTSPIIHPSYVDGNGFVLRSGPGACHISRAGCIRLGKALWWMMARIAGWNGTPSAGTNRPPVLGAIPDRRVETGNEVSFTVSATDIDSPALTYSASGLPEGAVFDPTTRIFAWTPSVTGAYRVSFEVSDGELSDFRQVLITVAEPLPDDALNLGLQAYYAFDEDWGTVLNDASPNRAQATVYGSPGRVPGMRNSGISLDGIDDYLDLGTGTFGLDETNSLTIAFWLYFDAAPGSTVPVIARGRYSYPFIISLDRSRKISCKTRTNAGTSPISSGSLPTGVWIHVALTFVSGTRTVYRNGTAAGADTFSGGLDLYPREVNPTFIGRSPGTSTSYFRGMLDELRIYNRALSAEEVETLFLSDRP